MFFCFLCLFPFSVACHAAPGNSLILFCLGYCTFTFMFTTGLSQGDEQCGKHREHIGLDEAHKRVDQQHEYRKYHRYHRCHSTDCKTAYCGKYEYQQCQNYHYHVTTHHVGKQTDGECRRLGEYTI